MAYLSVGKYHPSNSDARNGDKPDKIARFVYDHMGHELELVGEYGGTQERWMETIGVDAWTEAIDGRREGEE